MKGLMSLAWVDLKLSLRNVIATFFTLVFPILMILLFGAMYGNSPNDAAGGIGVMDAAVPGYAVALVIGSAAFMGLPIELVSRRQSGVLRRFRLTPLPAWAAPASLVAVNFIVCLFSTAVLIATGAVAWATRMPSNVLLLAPAFLLCASSQFAVGFLIATVVRSAKAALAVGMAVFYPMMFLSGGTIPIEYLPGSLHAVTPWLPMSWAVRLLHGVWLGAGWDATSSFILAAILVTCCAAALLLGRRE
jgi:ABC-2 type transport system permease protein